MTRAKEKSLARAGATSHLQRIEDPVVIGNDGSIRIDTSRLSAPQNLYDADYLWARRRNGAVSLFFGKESLQEPGKLRSRLELRYSHETFYHHLWRNSRKFHDQLRESLAARSKHDGTANRRDPSTMSCDKDHSDWVNLDYLAYSGSHACLDFFNLSLPGLARFAQGTGSAGLTLSPVVRVQTTARELLFLLDECGRIMEELKADGSVELDNDKSSV